MELNEIKVSVIVPMYNVSHVLDKAIETLFAQTLEGVEYIFVDDCSTDNTRQLLTKSLPTKKGITVKVLHHECNRGVAAARNTGLDNATGEYIYYVDADDYIEPYTLERLYNYAVENNADIVGCEWFLSFERNERHMKQAHPIDGIDMYTKMAHGVMRWNLWLFMVRRNLYEENKLRFIEKMNMGEDMMIMMKLSTIASSVVMIHEPLYHYIQTNNNSLTKKFTAYQYQVSANAEEVGKYVANRKDSNLTDAFAQLKLTLKLPLLISDRKEDYITWSNWFPEVNNEAYKNKDIPWRTRFIQQAAAKRHFWILRLYYILVIKFVYGIIYR